LSLRAPWRSPAFEVTRFVLFSSRSSIGGGPYVVEAAYPLVSDDRGRKTEDGRDLLDFESERPMTKDKLVF
jgi:hypothetical protein